MSASYDKAMQEQKDAAERYRLQKEMVYRICHELSGTCVMKLPRNQAVPGDCDVENCSAMRAAFGDTIG